ncbi:MAG TPA: DbpA RNA binding domain-containing protein [Gemmatimonadales bacterium]|nr:DbpA RNA binding domain-containing protein [Gemmatimonadales bacterium]
MVWQREPGLDAAQRAALESGKSLVHVCPPAAWAAAPVLDLLPRDDVPGLRILIITPETSIGLELARAPGFSPAPALHVATGLARTAALLASAAVGSLCVAAADALELVRRAALKPAAARWLVLAWPEQALAAGHSAALDTLLAEAAEVPRLVLTADERGLADFLERHARRAPLGGTARLPDQPVAGPGIRYAVAPAWDRWRALCGVLDVLNPPHALVWDPGAALGMPPPPGAEPFEPAARAPVVVAMDLPDAATLAELRAAAPQVVVLLAAHQVSYLERLAGPLRPLRLAGETDTARTRVSEARRTVRARLQAGDLDAHLLALDPLFDEYDPALVAAALSAGGLTGPGAALAATSVEAAPVASWVRLRLDAGRRDQLRVADVVGLLLNAVGLSREDLGRVDLREGYTLVEVQAAAAERALAGLTGATVRGRRLGARVDKK